MADARNSVAFPIAPQIHRSRFHPFLSLPPFFGGCVVGILLSAAIVALGPREPLWSDQTMYAFIFAPYAFGAACIAFIELLVICSISPGSLKSRPWFECLLLGIALFVFVIGSTQLVHAVYGLTSAADAAEATLTLVIAILSASFTIVMPLLLVQWNSSARTSAQLPWFRRAILFFTALPLFSLVIAVAIQRSQARMFDRGCVDLAAWVKSNYATPGEHFGILLPAQFEKMSADRKVDALQLPDGRLVLLLKTSLWGHDCWSGVVYCSGPIHPGEIGKDSYGRPEFSFHDLSDSYIKEQIDDHHFIVAFDLG